MRRASVPDMKTNLQHLIGLDTLQTSEATAAVRSFNKFGRLAWERTQWPEATVLKQVIPDVRVRSVEIGNGGSGYTGAPAVGFSGGGGSGADGTVTKNSDNEVNGVAITNHGTGYTSAPTVAITGGSGSGATATATIIAVIDFNTTIDTVYNVWSKDPYGSDAPPSLGFRIESESGVSGNRNEYGLAIIENHSGTAPLWVQYRTPWSDYSATAADDAGFPYFLSEYAVTAAYSDWLAADGQLEKSTAILGQAEAILVTELGKLERQQRQLPYLNITTYGTSANQP